MRPAELRIQLKTMTLGQIAREHGRTAAEVRKAVLAAVRTELPKTLR
jgi:predicted transcriptional regulator